MVALVGAGDSNINIIEAAFPSVAMTVRGNEITLRGAHIGCLALEKLVAEMMVVIRPGPDLKTASVKRSTQRFDTDPTEHSFGDFPP